MIPDVDFFGKMLIFPKSIAILLCV